MTRNRAGALLAAIGIVVLLSEWIRTTWFGHSAEAWVIAFGVILGFIGFYIVDPVHAEQGAKFIIDNATSVIQPHAFDLSAEELNDLLCAGLAVMGVQHVEDDEAWEPTAEKGVTNGHAAIAHAEEIGLPHGVTVWCDLEGVAVGVPMIDVDAYCRNWYSAVLKAGYQPGLYVGWHAGLTPLQLWRLPFRAYWSAYNLNADQMPARVGPMMRQFAAKDADVPSGVHFEIDVDVITGDAMGRLPTLLAPEGWPV